MRELLIKDKRTHISEEAKEKLSFLQGNINRGDFEFNAAAVQPQLSTIQEVNTTGNVDTLHQMFNTKYKLLFAAIWRVVY